MLGLQRADDLLAALRAEAVAIEARQAGDPEVDRTRFAASTLDAERRVADDAVAESERDAAALRERIRVLDRQLYGGSVRNPQELLTLQRELEEARVRIASVEELELERMEAAESAAQAAGIAAAALTAAEERRAAAAGPDAAHLMEVRTAIDEALQTRAAAVAKLEAHEQDVYARVAAKRHPAVVRLNGDSCGGCRLPLAINEVRAIRARGELVQCPNCDRVVVP